MNTKSEQEETRTGIINLIPFIWPKTCLKADWWMSISKSKGGKLSKPYVILWDKNSLPKTSERWDNQQCWANGCWDIWKCLFVYSQTRTRRTSTPWRQEQNRPCQPASGWAELIEVSNPSETHLSGLLNSILIGERHLIHLLQLISMMTCMQGCL